jgi:hypothetical protein
MLNIVQIFAEKRQAVNSLYLESMKSMETATMSLPQTRLAPKDGRMTNMISISSVRNVTQLQLKKKKQSLNLKAVRA